MIASKHSNINLLWGELIIEQLARFGIRDICIAPGSRSTPLVLAAQAHKKMRCHCHFDERGLAFFALGLAKYDQQPIAIITTSGSAVANLLPAVVEAHQNKTPLIILSADRPPELVNCGANQAIEQPGIFSHFAAHTLNLPAADLSYPANKLLFELEQRITAQQVDQGVVHINCMFREPLYPIASSLTDFSDYLSTIVNTSANRQQPVHRRADMEIELSTAQRALLKTKKVLIVVAQREVYNQAEDQAFIHWAEQQHYPILLDCQASQPNSNNSIHYYDQLLHRHDFSQHLAEAEGIIQFGGRLISKRLQQFIANTVAVKNIPYWLISDKQQRHDPDHNVSQRFTCTAGDFLSALPAQLATQLAATDIASAANSPWLHQLQTYDQKFALWLTNYLAQDQTELTENYCAELSAVALLPKLLPEHSCLFLANSMPIRLYDMFAPVEQKKLSVFSNRGASGIDGILATAIGIAHKQRRAATKASATTLVIGDTSLLHDLNSLALAKNLHQEHPASDSPFIIIALNNDGGAIFNLLPTPANDQIKQSLYQMPHGLKFEQAAQMFAINYLAIHSLKAFEQSYLDCLKSDENRSNNIHLLEIIVPSEQTTNLIKAIGKSLRELPAL